MNWKTFGCIEPKTTTTTTTTTTNNNNNNNNNNNIITIIETMDVRVDKRELRITFVTSGYRTEKSCKGKNQASGPGDDVRRRSLSVSDILRAVLLTYNSVCGSQNQQKSITAPLTGVCQKAKPTASSAPVCGMNSSKAYCDPGRHGNQGMCE